MKKINLQDKIYSFAFKDGSKLKELKDFENTNIYVNSKNTRNNIISSFLLKGKIDIASSSVRGYSVLEHLTIVDGQLMYKENKVDFLHENGQEVFMDTPRNPVFMYNDKSVEEEFQHSLFVVDNEDKDEEINEEENTEEIESLEEHILNNSKFNEDVEPLVKRGYEIHEFEDYRMLNKEGSVPILCKIISPTHYEEYQFVKRDGEKKFIFKNFEDKQVTFEID